MSESTEPAEAKILTEQQRRELVELIARGNWRVSGTCGRRGRVPS